MLENKDKSLIGLLQSGFPLVIKPFIALSKQLDTSEEDIINRIVKLKQKGIIRIIGPIIEARRLGYKSALVAMSIPDKAMSVASDFVSLHSGISHAYERDNKYNIWITLCVAPSTDIGSEINKISRSCMAESSFSASALRVFKLRTYFGNDEDKPNEIMNDPGCVFSCLINLSDSEKSVINCIQRDLPLISSPFNEIADSVGMDVQMFLNVYRSLMEKGVIRRFGASINHKMAGFTSNAMCCWKVSELDLLKVAGALSNLKSVSHCYERETNRLWKYNLYAMIHGRSEQECQEIVEKISIDEQINDYQILFSTNEIKKTRVIYEA